MPNFFLLLLFWYTNYYYIDILMGVLNLSLWRQMFKTIKLFFIAQPLSNAGYDTRAAAGPQHKCILSDSQIQ